MELALFRRLELFTQLSSEDHAALSRLTTKIRVIEPRHDLIREGEPPTHVNLVLLAWGARYKMLPDGKRLLVGFFIPGDLCDLNTYILKQMDHSIGAIAAACRDVRAERSAATDGRQSAGHAGAALARMVSAAVQREWTHNVGARPAFQRLAHLFVEVFIRMRSVGLAGPTAAIFRLPNMISPRRQA